MIIGPKAITQLIRRYNGFGAELTPDEKEILIFALHTESEARGGIAAEAMRGLVIRLTGEGVESEASTAPLAICLAALRAVGYEVPE